MQLFSSLTTCTHYKNGETSHLWDTWLSEFMFMSLQILARCKHRQLSLQDALALYNAKLLFPAIAGTGLHRCSHCSRGP
jgi:hypothetical protein